MTSFFNMLFEMSIKAVIVIVAVLIVRLFFSKAPKKFSYMLWIIVAFRLCVPFSIESNFSIFNLSKDNNTPINEEYNETSNPQLSYDNIDPNELFFGNLIPEIEKENDTPIIENVDFSQSITEIPNEDSVIPNNIENKVEINTEKTVNDEKTPFDWKSFGKIALGVIYFAGFFGMLAYGIVSYIILSKKMRKAIRLKDNIYCSEEISTPFTLGFIKPRIYIPYGISEVELECIIAHENYHIKRLDYIIKPFAYILLSIHWFNLFCWIAFNRMSFDMEMSCDEKVLSCYETNDERKQYTKTLLSIATQKRYPAPSPIAFNDGGNAKKRIKHALYWKKSKIWVNIVCFLICFAVLFACGTDSVINNNDDTNVNSNEPVNIEFEVYKETKIRVNQIFDFTEDRIVADSSFGMVIVDSDGKIINNNFKVIYPFRNSKSLVISQDGDRYFIDKNANIISDKLDQGTYMDWLGTYGEVSDVGISFDTSEFDDISSFYNGYATFIKDEKLGIIDLEGEIIIQPTLSVKKYSDAVSICNGRIAYISENGYLCIANIKNLSQIETDYLTELIKASKNQNNIIDENGNILTFDKYALSLYEEYNFKVEAQTFLDLDSDGKSELICRLNGPMDYIVLRHNEGIYAYYIHHRAFQSLKNDGSYMGSSGASVNSIYKTSFDENNKRIEDEIARYWESNDECEYKINGTHVSKDKIEKYFDDWYKKSDAIFYTSNEVINIEFISDSEINNIENYIHFVEESDDNNMQNIIFTTDKMVTDFVFYDEGYSLDDPLGKVLFEADVLSPNIPIVISAPMDGSSYHREFSYVDLKGNTKYFNISISIGAATPLTYSRINIRENDPTKEFEKFINGEISAINKHDNSEFYIDELKNEQNQHQIHQYTFTDLNGDSLNEMVTKGYDYGNLLSVYAYIDGKVTRVYTEQGMDKHSLLVDGHILSEKSLIGKYYTYYNFDEDYTHVSVTFSEPNDHDELSYLFNDKQVSKEEYESLTGDIFKTLSMGECIYWRNLENDDSSIIENFNEEITEELEYFLFEGSSKYTAVLVFENSDKELAKALVIKDENDRLIQYIQFDDNEAFKKIPLVIDVNFDAYSDILVPNYKSVTSGTYYQAFLWDSTANKYIYTPSFINYPNFSLDHQNKYVLTYRNYDMTVLYSIHQYNEKIKDFVKISSLYFEYDRQNETFSYKEYQNEIIIRNISDIDGDFWQNFEACGIDDITKHFHEDSLFNLNSSKWRKTPYEYYMNHLEGNSSENALYFLKDIDNNGIVDLILLKNSMFTIYTYNGNITKMCEHDFVIGTARWFSSDNPEYPGIFYMTVGGSAEHHGYMYLKNGELCFEDLWVEKYTDTAENIIENISDNSDLVEESKKLYANGKDIDFKLIS